MQCANQCSTNSGESCSVEPGPNHRQLLVGPCHSEVLRKYYILDSHNNAAEITEDDQGHHLPLQHQEELPAQPHHRGEETGQGLKERPYH